MAVEEREVEGRYWAFPMVQAHTGWIVGRDGPFEDEPAEFYCLALEDELGELWLGFYDDEGYAIRDLVRGVGEFACIDAQLRVTAKGFTAAARAVLAGADTETLVGLGYLEPLGDEHVVFVATCGVRYRIARSDLTDLLW